MSDHEPRSYATKSDFAYTRLREGILAGTFAPGAVLQQSMLAKTIGISTTPLREALRRLMSEGLVELDAHRDARITPLTLEEARDLIELRLSLDPLAASLAAQRRTRDDIRNMRERFEFNEPLTNNPTVAKLTTHRVFHQAIYEASHNELLIATLNGLWDKADRYRRLGLNVPRTAEERAVKAREHRELLEAVIRGDSEAASQVMVEHITTSLGARAASHLGAEVTPTLAPLA